MEYIVFIAQKLKVFGLLSFISFWEKFEYAKHTISIVSKVNKNRLLRTNNMYMSQHQYIIFIIGV